MIQIGKRLTGISNDDVELTGLLLNELGSCFIILFVSRGQLHSVNVRVFSRQVFERLRCWVACACEHDCVGALSDGGSETETNAAVGTRD